MKRNIIAFLTVFSMLFLTTGVISTSASETKEKTQNTKDFLDSISGKPPVEKEKKNEVYAAIGYHHSEPEYFTNVSTYEVGVRRRINDKFSISISELYMQQKIFDEQYLTHTKIDFYRTMVLVRRKLTKNISFDFGPMVTFFKCRDEAKNDFGRKLTLPAQPGGVFGLAYQKKIKNSWFIELGMRRVMGNIELRGAYGQPDNNSRGEDYSFGIKNNF